MLTSPTQEVYLKLKMSFFSRLRGWYLCPLASDSLPVDRQTFYLYGNRISRFVFI